MYTVNWKNRAFKQLTKISDAVIRNEIYDAAATLVDFPNVTQVKKLANHRYDYRLRVGRYRIFFDVSDAVRIVSIEEVKKRDDHTY